MLNLLNSYRVNLISKTCLACNNKGGETTPTSSQHGSLGHLFIMASRQVFLEFFKPIFDLRTALLLRLNMNLTTKFCV